MNHYNFAPLSQIRLQVEDEWPGLPNLVPNPVGTYGTWGWDWKVISSFTTVSGPAFRLTRGTFNAGAVSTDLIAVRGSDFGGGGTNRYVRGRVRRVGGTSGVGFTARFDFYDKAKELLSSTTATAAQNTNGTLDVPAVLVSSLVKYVGLRIMSNAPTSGNFVEWTDVCVVNGTSAEVAVTPTVEPDWVDILSPASSVTIVRNELDLGTLNASIRDSNLDPAQATVIRKGKAVRASALTGSSVWENLFTGKVINADVTYDLREPDASKRARIELQAADAASGLASTPRPDGVATIAELPFVLAGAGIPWNVNGSTNIFGTSAVVEARSDTASALDQVALTRDTALGYAWVSRNGVLNAWDNDQISTTVVTTLDEDDYSDLGAGYEFDDLINDVSVIVRSIDPDTGETVETKYGPFVDEVSQREWGKAHKDFTVLGSGWTETTAETYADTILAANAVPRVRITGVTLPVTQVAHIASSRALLDLYDRVTAVNADNGLSQTLRVSHIEHTITPSGWLMRLSFGETGSVASPTLAPAPAPAQSNGDTAWTDLPLANSWVYYGSPYTTPQYRRLKGVVYFKGLVKSGTLNAPIFTLPAGFRTSAVMHIPLVSNGFVVITNIYPNGDFYAPSTASSNWIALDAISYVAEA